MQATGTTRMSARGQIVLPLAIRTSLGLKPGTDFIVVAEGDVVVLKRITAPSIREFDSVIATVREQARRSGVRAGDVREAVRRARAER